MSYVCESDSLWKVMTIWISRASVVQFRVSRWVMSANRTSLWKVMTIRISRVLPLCNFEHLDILCPKFGHPCEKLWPFEFLEYFLCAISSLSIHYVLNSDIRVKSYDHSNSRELPFFNFECLDISFTTIVHPCQKLWPLEFLLYFRCAISSISIY